MGNKILDQSQAEAVYLAMCHLNKVGGVIKATLPIPAMNPPLTSSTYIRVFEDEGAVKVVRSVNHGLEVGEFYDNQAAFAAAYNLIQGGPLHASTTQLGTQMAKPDGKTVGTQMPSYEELLAALAEANHWAEQRCDGAAANAVQRLFSKFPALRVATGARQ